MAEVKTSVVDPCGEFGKDQKWAVVWFVAVIAIGIVGVCALKGIDRTMYDTNAEFFDYGAYRENRLSQASLRSDSIDPRSHGDLESVLERK